MDHQELLTWRKSLGLIQRKAAFLLDLTEQGYIHREKGRVPITHETLYATRYLSEHPEEVARRLADWRDC
ncbi:hypothetical protein FACS1894205_6000 [Alphaproteobacteria bacterium]|nr:hypothetical protein FACS1894205_6000 [Alphaproteobacteria bacterium]